MKSVFIRFIFILNILVLSTSAMAQEAQPVDGNALSDAEVLLDTLKDDTKRAAFISQLEAFVSVQKSTEAADQQSLGEVIIRTVTSKMDAVGGQLASVAREISNIPALLSSTWAFLSDAENRNAWLLMAAQLAVIIVAGVMAERIAKRMLRRFHASIEQQNPDGASTRLFFIVTRTVLDLVAVSAFLAGAYATMTLVGPAHTGQVLALAVINASVLARVIQTLSKTCLAPRVSQMRLIPLNDENANYIFVWLRRLTYFLAYSYFLVEAMPALGVSEPVHVIAAKTVGLVTAAMLIVLIMQVKNDVGDLMRGDPDGAGRQLRQRLADVWHVVAILYVIAIFGVWALEVPGGFNFVFQSTVISVVILVIAYAVSTLARKSLRKAFSISADQKARFPGLEARANRYLPALVSGVRVLIYISALLGILNVWGIDAIGWIATPIGIVMVKSSATIVLIILVALLVWETLSLAIERYLVLRDQSGTNSQRALTLLPLLRNAVLIALVILVTLTVLSELGVDIGPLIAGAGIIGLAVGFGAQTLVKDVITGFFILIEDSVAVGDLVVLGGYRGKVESMSLRSIQLRDLHGDVHRIPFSEVSSTTNRSKIFSFAFFDIGVAYREDVDHCMNVIREVGAEMRQDANFAAMIIEDLEIMGVQSFDDSAVIIRARLKVLPGKQLGVQRAFNRLIKNRFDAEGIEIPFPHRTIYFGVDGEGNAPPAFVQVQEQTGRGAKREKATLTKAPEGEHADFDEEPIDETEHVEKK